MKHIKERTRGNQYQGNGNLRTYPGVAKPSAMTEREEAYYAALNLVARIDEDLTKGIRHYRNKAGTLLLTLDEVIRAILDNDLQLEERQAAERVWLTPQELAA